MNWKQAILAAELLFFVALTLIAVSDHGYLGFFDLALANSATTLLFVDLLICLSLVAIWMVLDARRTGQKAWPYLIVALFFGAAGPLLYLIIREGRSAQSDAMQPTPDSPTLGA
ncbi:MAG: DUF2834 domain-containing protein [Acidobacteriota bacterium]